MNCLFRIFLVSSYTLLMIIFPQTLSMSCGPMLPPDAARFSLFRSELGGGAGLVPFYYTHYYLNLSGDEASVSDHLVNCREWQQYMGGQVSERDIFQIQYRTTPDDFLYAYRSGDWSQFSGNQFVRWLRRNESALQYMVYAKQLEFQQLGNKDPWASLESPDFIDPASQDAGGFRAIDYLVTARDSFLRVRWAFQAVKESYYKAYYKQRYQVVESPETRRLYEQELKGKHSIVARWALLYYALSHTDKVKRTRYLLETFDQTEEKKTFVYKWLDEDMLTELSGKTDDTHIQCLIEVLRAIRTPGPALQHLQLAYALEPNSEYLPLLISREINKIEDWIWSPELLGFANWPLDVERTYAVSNRNRDLAYLQNLKTFLQNVLSEQHSSPQVIRLALVHAYHMLGEWESAEQILDQLPDQLPSQLQRQAGIERVINLSHRRNVREPEVQQTIFTILEDLKAAGMKSRPTLQQAWWYGQERNEMDDDISELLLMLSKTFERRGDRVKAGLLYQKADLVTNTYTGTLDPRSVSYRQIAWFDQYASATDMDSLLVFKKRRSKSAFERFLSPETWPPDAVYYDLKGTKLLREGQYEAALLAFEKIDDKFWAEHYAFKDHLPKYSITSVGSYLPVREPNLIQYALQSKKLVMREFNSLLKRSRTEQQSDTLASIAYQLGNSLFNMSYWGRAWMMFSYGRSERERWQDGSSGTWAFFSFWPEGQRYADRYYRLADAKAMYRRALALDPSDRELQAKCQLMLYLCERIVTEAMDREKFKPSEDLELALRTLSDTRVMDLARTHCPDLNK